MELLKSILKAQMNTSFRNNIISHLDLFALVWMSHRRLYNKGPNPAVPCVAPLYIIFFKGFVSPQE